MGVSPAAYQTEALQEYVAEFLAQEYQVDKAGARAALFAREENMAGEAPEEPGEAIGRRVGAWGAA